MKKVRKKHNKRKTFLFPIFTNFAFSMRICIFMHKLLMVVINYNYDSFDMIMIIYFHLEVLLNQELT